MRKHIPLILGVLLLLGIVVAALNIPNRALDTSFGASNPYALATCSIDGSDSNDATSSVVYLTTTAASSTLACPGFRADQADLNLRFTSSTTASALQWEWQFSNNNIDWYSEDGQSVDSTHQTTHGANAMIHKWTPATTATTTKNITTSDLGSQRFRILFNVTGANGALWAQTVLRSPSTLSR